MINKKLIKKILGSHILIDNNNTMGGIISTIIRYSFYSTIIGATALTAFLCKTLPSDESFHTYFSKGRSIASWGRYFATQTIFQPQFKSYVIVKTAEISITDSDRKMWIGVANNWFPLSDFTVGRKDLR